MTEDEMSERGDFCFRQDLCRQTELQWNVEEMAFDKTTLDSMPVDRMNGIK